MKAQTPYCLLFVCICFHYYRKKKNISLHWSTHLFLRPVPFPRLPPTRVCREGRAERLSCCLLGPLRPPGMVASYRGNHGCRPPTNSHWDSSPSSSVSHHVQPGHCGGNRKTRLSQSKTSITARKNTHNGEYERNKKPTTPRPK